MKGAGTIIINGGNILRYLLDTGKMMGEVTGLNDAGAGIGGGAGGASGTIEIRGGSGSCKSAKAAGIEPVEKP